MKRRLLLFLFVTSSLTSFGQIRLMLVDGSLDMIGIKNFGTGTVDVSSWYICDRITYTQISGMTPVKGSTNLAAGDTVILMGASLNPTSSDVGLYITNSFTDTAAMKDFMQYGAAGLGRESVAASKGIWTAGDFVPSFPPFAYFGDGVFDWGVTFWGQPAPPLPDYAYAPTAPCIGETVTFSDSSTGVIDNWFWDFGPGATPATASTQGPHMVSYATSGTKQVKLRVDNAFGADSITQNVVVATSLTVNITGPGAGCGNDTITLDAGSPYDTYAWSTGDSTQTIQVTSANTYSVTVTIGSCTGNNSKVVAWYPSPPKPSLNYNSSTMVLAVDSVGYSGALFFRDGNSFASGTYTVAITQTGNYWAMVSDSNGCVAFSDTLSITTGLADVYGTASLQIRPNPASSTIRIEGFGQGDDLVGIFDPLGSQHNVPVQKGMINVESLAQGAYIIIVRSGSTLVTGRFIKL